MHVIARATRIATQERWNVPQVRTALASPKCLAIPCSTVVLVSPDTPQVPSPSPSAINIQVTTEMGNDNIKGYENTEFSENPKRGGRNSVPSKMNFIVIE